VIVTNYLRNRLRKLIPAALLLSPALIADFISQTAGNLVCDAARKLWYEGNQAIRELLLARSIWRMPTQRQYQ
jgi:hypothetical protein